MAMWHDQKKTDYTQLRLDCENKGWKVYPLYVEVGCRGHVSQSFHYMCKVLGFSKQEEKELKFYVAVWRKTAQQCSHAISPIPECVGETSIGRHIKIAVLKCG